ncbi:hypothetical protein CPC08DRAFT_713005 [Agrocybe pediades]|nr:hypothetical protein CPC08DRAFT_713005 [Agrocybe pediades]
MPLLPSTTDDSLFDNLPPGDIYRYSRACKDAYSAVSSYIRRRFRIQSVLGKYFTDNEILELRELQYHTGMLVSGSTALQFFERVVYPDSDLDLYVEHRYRREVAAWLLSTGYTYVERPIWPLTVEDNEPNETLEEILDRVPSTEEDDESQTDFLEPEVPRGYFGAAILMNFEKKNPVRKIQVITCHFAPLQMILNFHSTCVMNILTYDKAYAFFPHATFDEHKSLVNLPSNARWRRRYVRRSAAIGRYKERGWEPVYNITRQEYEDPKSMFAHGVRRVGDAKCWTIPLFPKLDLPEGSIQTSSWSLYYDKRLEPRISFGVFYWKRLKFSHLFADELLSRHIADVAGEIEDRLRDAQQTNEETDIEFRRKVNLYLDLFYSEGNGSTFDPWTRREAEDIDRELEERAQTYLRISS